MITSWLDHTQIPWLYNEGSSLGGMNTPWLNHTQNTIVLKPGWLVGWYKHTVVEPYPTYHGFKKQGGSWSRRNTMVQPYMVKHNNHGKVGCLTAVNHIVNHMVLPYPKYHGLKRWFYHGIFLVGILCLQ